MDALGYFAAIIVGVSLGLIGGGGSILTVPIFVYLFGIEPVLATAYSLFVVGISSLTGVITKIRNKLVHMKTALVFAIPSIVSVYLTRLFIVPNLPEKLLSIGNFQVSKSLGIMLFFAFIMLLAAYSMIKSKKKKEPEVNEEVKFNYPLIIAEGLLIGIISGLVGAGGGFLIIPALVLFAKLPMKLAVGTSLAVISLKSLLGFVGDIQSGQAINWAFLLVFSSLAILGIFLGNYLNQYISGEKLKRGFGFFVIVMALIILVKELN